MIRTGHFYHDVRELLGDPKILIAFLLIGVALILFVNLQFIYVFALLFGLMLGLRGVIGRRCPICDGALVETGAETDKHNAFILYVNWSCPRDGYAEKEKTKGDGGLFGVN